MNQPGANNNGSRDTAFRRTLMHVLGVRALLLAVAFPWLGPLLGWLLGYAAPEGELLQMIAVPLLLLVGRAGLAAGRVREAKQGGRMNSLCFQLAFGLSLLALCVFEFIATPFRHAWASDNVDGGIVELTVIFFGAYVAYVVLSFVAEACFLRAMGSVED